MEPYISLRQIMELIEDVFGFNQSEVADILGINKSQMSNAVKGKRYINRNDVGGVFYHKNLAVPADNGNDEKRYAKEQILNHLQAKGILYPDIAKKAEMNYADVVTAILNHYPSEDKITKPYEELLDKGNEYSKNGNYGTALEYYLEAERKVQGDRRKEMDLYVKMAYIYLKKGEYAKSLNLYFQARDISRFINGDDSFDTARIHENIGVVLRKDRQYDEAKESFISAEKILAGRLETNPNDPYVARLYNDFGLMNLNEKNFKETYYYYKKAYTIRENNYLKYGKEEENLYVLEYAYAIHNMGTYYNKSVTDRMKDLSEDDKRRFLLKAAEYHEKAYDLRVELLNGEDVLKVVKRNDPLANVCLDIAQSLTQWASDLLELGDVKTAMEKCELGLKIREEKYGKGAEIQDIAWSFYTLGLIYDKLGEPKKSLDCFSESHRIRLKVCNGDHPYAAKALFQMGRVKHSLSKSDALLDLQKARQIQERSLKKDDPELVDTISLIRMINDKSSL